ncbi:uncharacterized protein LOC135202563 [Macrobrachium nipponense]|uniref:uncharacterized protein LOC135202563 n=1 Tax=Macrobrachium nipponense TaxID=159736 RepID=UPI0030C8A5B0
MEGGLVNHVVQSPGKDIDDEGQIDTLGHVVKKSMKQTANDNIEDELVNDTCVQRKIEDSKELNEVLDDKGPSELDSKCLPDGDQFTEPEILDPNLPDKEDDPCGSSGEG